VLGWVRLVLSWVRIRLGLGWVRFMVRVKDIVGLGFV
jgi:hypothetical protein